MEDIERLGSTDPRREVNLTGKPFVRLDREPGDLVAEIVFDRPERLNAWQWTSTNELCAICDDLRFDDQVRVVVIRGEGRAFCAGEDLRPERHDVRERHTGRSPAEQVRNSYERARYCFERWHVVSDLPQPVIVAIQGYCLGAGVELALLGDIRVAADNAIFAMPQATIGVPVVGGADMRMAGECGAGAARLLAFTGRRFSAEQAEQIGFVQQVVPPTNCWPPPGPWPPRSPPTPRWPCKASNGRSTPGPGAASPRRPASRPCPARSRSSPRTCTRVSRRRRPSGTLLRREMSDLDIEGFDDAMFDVAAVENGAWAPGPYGPADRLGTYNEVTPQRSAAALGLLDLTRPVATFNLGETVFNGFPAFGNRPYDQHLVVSGYSPSSALRRRGAAQPAPRPQPAQLARGAGLHVLQPGHQDQRSAPLRDRDDVLQRLARA